MSDDSRHPWTHAADFIRALGPISRSGVVLSRSDASNIIEGVARALGEDHYQFAARLSRAEQNKSEKDIAYQHERLVREIGYR